MSDTINFEILENGTIRVKTNSISPANHMSADSLLANMEKLLGGKVEITKNPDKHGHVHVQHVNTAKAGS